MTIKTVIIDDATQQEMPTGTVYYNVAVEYSKNDTDYNVGIPSFLYKDSSDWNAVGAFLATGLPANTTSVKINRRTA